MITTYMISMDGNVAAATNSTTLALIVVLGIILFVIFVYILIRQTVNALDLLKINKGLVWDGGSKWNVGGGSKVIGYNSKRAY